MVACIPAQEAGRCPRCRFAYDLVAVVPGGTTFLCAGCEWTLTLASQPVQSLPAIPATTVTQANTSGTPVAVTVTGGTVTVIAVNGVTTGQTSGIVIVPVGGTISITYSVVPTSWAWALPLTNGATTLASAALPFAHWGTAFTIGQLLMVDTGSAAEVVQVSGTPTDTSVPCSGFSKAHNSGVAVGICAPTATYTSVQTVPVSAY